MELFTLLIFLAATDVTGGRAMVAIPGFTTLGKCDAQRQRILEQTDQDFFAANVVHTTCIKVN